jgi:hypothetical protein
MYDSFDNTYQATIGIDFLSKTMYLEDRTVIVIIIDKEMCCKYIVGEIATLGYRWPRALSLINPVLYPRFHR